MPATSPAANVVADTRERSEIRISSTPPQDGQAPRRRNAGAFLTSRRARRGERNTSYYDPLFGQPDLVENDYYRFGRCRGHQGTPPTKAQPAND
jgi:hypothetical protein